MVPQVKHSAEYQRFDNLLGDLLSGMQRREAEYRKQVDANPNRRGPKRGSEKEPTSRQSPDAPLIRGFE
jgi:hypothetical protein